MNLKRFVALACVVVLGIAAGVGVSAVVGGGASDNPCEGFGTLADEIDVRAEDSSTGKAERYHVCEQLGYRVIIDADTRAVVHTAFREEELLEYYQQHPEENPLEIARKTSEAQLADTFVPLVPPDAKHGGDCPPDSSRVPIQLVGVSLCLPKGWTLDGERAEVSDGYSVGISIGARELSGTAGTKCREPAVVDLSEGQLRVCALPVDVFGLQGHGVIFASGREGGMSIRADASPEQRDLAFQVLYSVREEVTSD